MLLVPIVRDRNEADMPAGGAAVIEISLSAVDLVDSVQSVAGPQTDAPPADMASRTPDPTTAENTTAESDAPAPNPPAAEPPPVAAAVEALTPELPAQGIVAEPTVDKQAELEAVQQAQMREAARQAGIRRERLEQRREARLEQLLEERRERERKERVERQRATREEKARAEREQARRERFEKARAERAAQAKAERAETARSSRERGQGSEAANSAAATRGGTVGDAGGAAQTASWRGQVLSHLLRYKQYPSAAREKGIQGQPVVAFSLAGSGAVTSVSLVRSSGASILDEAAVAMVWRASPFPRNPAGAGANFSAPLNFNLR
jgi:protein TonB